MTWWQKKNFDQKKQNLLNRAKLIKAVRTYFDDQDFWEVETPALQVMPCADMHIHGFETQLWGRDLKPRRTLYLHTSPEFEMKKLLVAGCPKIYQICKVFRNGEESRLHSPEFTMLEWYRANDTYKTIMQDCIGLVRACAAALEMTHFKAGNKAADPFLDWNMITVTEAFDKYAKIDLIKTLDNTELLYSELAARGLQVKPNDSWEELFLYAMTEWIEPQLGIGAPTIIYDYPLCTATLSRKKEEDQRFTERFELYICGVELANAFGELTEAAEQKRRFEQEMQLKKEMYGFNYPVDYEFINAIEHGMPDAGGIALGIDRLVLLACGADNIKQVLWSESTCSY